MDSHQKVKLLQEDFIYTCEVMAGESGSIVFGG
jgi:V8-like Glu-specific endopeptidase